MGNVKEYYQNNKTVCRAILGIAVILGGVYGVGTSYFSNKFLLNSTVHKVDVSKLDGYTAGEKVQNNISNFPVELSEDGKLVTKITYGELGVSVGEFTEFYDMIGGQNNFAWIIPEKHDLYLTGLQVDSEKAKEKLAELLKFKADDLKNEEERTESVNAYIRLSDLGEFEIVPEYYGNTLNLDYLVGELEKGVTDISLNGAYVEPTILQTDQALNDRLAVLQNKQNMELKISIKGDEVAIPKAVIGKMLHIEDDEYEVKPLREWLDDISTQYNLWDGLEFGSTYRGTVKVAPGTMYTGINKDLVVNEVVARLNGGENTAPIDTEVKTLGGDYIEVDLINQVMLLYLNGTKQVETPIVSGSKNSPTVPGAYTLWSKERNRTLKGFNNVIKESYASPVQYWMPFDAIGQGIHDASWQPVYGGDWYVNNGSLGCINTPLNAVAQIYNLAYVGIPVLVF